MSMGSRYIPWAVLALGGVNFGSVQAADHQLDGQFLSVSYDEARVPADFAQVSLLESAPVWVCNAVRCGLTESLSATLLFAPVSGKAVTVTSQTLDFQFETLTKRQVLLDPLGHQWDVSADLGKWRIGVDIALQAPQGSDAQFATAYGQFSARSADGALPPTWPNGISVIPDPKWGEVMGERTPLGLNRAGKFGVGPGHDGADVSGGGAPWAWTYRTQLDGANYAYPSLTDVHCASLSCMRFMTGNVAVNNYFLSFDVVASPSAVPESSTLAMMALGLGSLVWAVRHRRG